MEREVEQALKDLNDCWVELETKGADFGDLRLNERYRRVLERMSQMPQAPLNQSTESYAELLAAYRFIDNDKVTIEKLLDPHREQVARRAEGEKVVLLSQDTSYFDLNDHIKKQDLQPLKHLDRALWVHGTLCVLPDGLPLGVVDAQFMTGEAPEDKSKIQSRRPIEEKLSRRWMQSVDNCADIFGNEITKVWVSDRESDIYEYIERVLSIGDDCIVRAKYFREIEEGPYFDMRNALEQAPAIGCYQFTIPGNGSRPKRDAKVEVKYTPATVCVPLHKQNVVSLKSLPLFLVEVAEVDPPEDVEPICWRLLTNRKVESFEDALEIISWYSKRWPIEEIFKILKSGCRAEKAQFHTTERLVKYVTLSMIVAWRIYFLVYVNRINPNAPAKLVLTTSEIDTLQFLLDDKTKRQGKKRRVIIRTARQAITEVAKMGGYLNRKSDPYPGIVVMWRGTMALAFATMTFLAERRRANE